MPAGTDGCPRCSVRLQSAEPSAARSCPRGCGAFLDEDELRRSVGGASFDLVAALVARVGAGAATTAALVCPVCRDALGCVHLGGVELDVCARCRGVWLDAGEIVARAEQGPRTSAAPFSSAVLVRRARRAVRWSLAPQRAWAAVRALRRRLWTATAAERGKPAQAAFIVLVAVPMVLIGVGVTATIIGALAPAVATLAMIVVLGLAVSPFSKRTIRRRLGLALGGPPLVLAGLAPALLLYRLLRRWDGIPLWDMLGRPDHQALFVLACALCAAMVMLAAGARHGRQVVHAHGWPRWRTAGIAAAVVAGLGCSTALVLFEAPRLDPGNWTIEQQHQHAPVDELGFLRARLAKGGAEQRSAAVYHLGAHIQRLPDSSLGAGPRPDHAFVDLILHAMVHDTDATVRQAATSTLRIDLKIDTSYPITAQDRINNSYSFPVTRHQQSLVIEALSHSDPVVRLHGADMAAALGLDIGDAPVTAALAEPDPEPARYGFALSGVRWAVLRALALGPNPARAYPVLVGLLSSPDAVLREQGVCGLGLLGKPAAAALPLLPKALDEGAPVRCVAEVVVAAGPAGREVLLALFAKINAGQFFHDYATVLRAARSVGATDEEVLRGIERYFDPGLRASRTGIYPWALGEALDILDELKAPAPLVVRLAVQTLRDGPRIDQRTAASALKVLQARPIEARDALPEVRTFLSQSTDAYLQGHAIELLLVLDPQGSAETRSTIAAMEQSAAWEGVRGQARAALAQLDQVPQRSAADLERAEAHEEIAR